jgi:CheY-like chemotaxis protein
MSRKRALIVDDSKSARVSLSRMLENYDIEVDMSESAEQAIEYLEKNRPDAIFMDHLMPGMDGLQAVQAIKGNPQTAMIPIMMYTSQEGELYVGQARALGALGVLPKQLRPVDVSKVLYELHLLPDRRDAEVSALRPVEIEAGATPEPVPEGGGRADHPQGTGADSSRRVESVLKQQAVELRRFLVASLDSLASRIVIDVRNSLPAAKPAQEPAVAIVPPAPSPRAPWPWIAAAGAFGIAMLVFVALWIDDRTELAKLHVQVSDLGVENAQLTRARQDLAENIKDLTAALAAMPFSAPAPSAAVPALRTESVPYGEMPLDRSRSDTLREVVAKLAQQGFRGVVKVTSFPGQFCLTGNPSDGLTQAAAALPFNKCDVVGNAYDEASSGQLRQSLAFANQIAGIRQLSGGAITVVIENAPSGRTVMPYPARSEGLTAGEWNKAAAANNRVEFSAEPAGR